MPTFSRSLLVVCALFGSACTSGRAAPDPMPKPETGHGAFATPASIERARVDSIRRPYTEADVKFMTGMIAHHAQAIQIAEWAKDHGASAVIQRLAARIINAQKDEIFTMQSWLAARGRPVPDPTKVGMMRHDDHGMSMPGMQMPGMLTMEQLMALDAARGVEFDKLFLHDMIQHHSGAVLMVEELFATDGAAQDEVTFKFGNDVQVDQRTEIARMQQMLAEILFREAES